MCGRFTLTATGKEIAQHFDLKEAPIQSPRYNIAPTQAITTVVMQSQRQVQQMRWGLIPSWAKDRKMGNRLINARIETAADKPSFRHSLKHKRCLVVADGYYEWQRQQDKKQPYYFQLAQGQLFAFAGLWDSWQSPDGETIVSCTILTTAASQQVSPVHDRMPVIVSPDFYSQWLNPSLQEPKQLLPMLESDIYQRLGFYPVSPVVNRPTHDSDDCIRSLNSA
ncbi:MAG: SOS response-associated peptidase [Cyanophyceae cyanobacterium]